MVHLVAMPRMERIVVVCPERSCDRTTSDIDMATVVLWQNGSAGFAAVRRLTSPQRQVTLPVQLTSSRCNLLDKSPQGFVIAPTRFRKTFIEGS